MQKLIFTCAPARSGTAYAARLLSITSNIYAAHEPDPSFSDVMRKGQENPTLLYDFMRYRKLPAIMEALGQSGKSIYLETSHLFGAGFFEVCLDLGIKFDLLLIERNPIQIAKSLHALDTVPGITPKGKKYLIQPDDPHVIMQLPSWKAHTSYELCLWYASEMCMRAEKYSQIMLLNNRQVYRTSIEKIQDNFDTLCSDIGAGFYDRNVFNTLRYEKINSKQNIKKREP